MKNKYGIIKPIGEHPNSKKVKDYKNMLIQLTPEQHETVIGGILGDVSIGREQRSSGSFKHRLKFEWGNHEYAKHIYGLYEE